MAAVEVLPAGVRFECGDDEPILTAAIRAGFSLPYGCRKGNCGTCKAQVLDGDVDLEVESTHSLSSFEREQGFTLLCSAYAVGDVVVEMENLDLDDVATGLAAPRTIAGRVESVERLTHDIRSLAVLLDDPVEFRAGQFADVQAPGTDLWRSYSMASPPSEPRRVEFMIKIVPGGAFSGRLDLFGADEPITVRAPHGSFWVRDGDRPLLLLGGGAGIGPLWSMVQDLAERGDPRPVRFVYGARAEHDLFHLDRLEEVGGKLADFSLTVALSEDDAAAHAHGLVTDVAERILGPELSRSDAYLCGPPPMVDAALALLEGHGLEERRSIFYDKFTPT